MEIYLQKDGLGKGPHLMFQIREMLASGQLTPEDIAWHEGQAAWLPIKEMPSLRHLLPGSPAVADESPSDEPVPPLLPTIMAEPELMTKDRALLQQRLETLVEQQTSRHRHGWVWRRFWARMIDTGAFFTVLWLVAWQLGVLDLLDFVLTSPSVSMVSLAIWVLVESLLLNALGTTPGKALLGLRVVDDFGNRPDMPTALKRSVGVWFHGMAVGIELARIIFQVMAMRRFLVEGRTVWDGWAGTQVQVKPLGTLPIIAAVILVVAWWTVRTQALLSLPPAQLPPQLKQLMEQLQPPAPAEKPKTTLSI